MGIETELLSQPVNQLNLNEFTSIESGTSIQTTLDQMREQNRNCAFILKSGSLVGIFTDRDILRRVVDRPDLWKHPIDEVMTHNPRTITASQTTGDALKLMHDLHIRNAPVMSKQGKLLGNLTHFALISYLADCFPEEVLNLPPEANHYGEDRYGG